MFFRARRSLQRAWFNFHCRGVLRTAPLVSDDAGITLVSMVCHGEVLMYLLAVKSFCRQLGRHARVVVLNDGSFTGRDREILKQHIPSGRIVDITEISTDGCPKGSCWERLFLIGDIVADSYVVQVDSDTLTLAPIPEIASCIEANRSFTLLGDRSHAEVETMAEASVRSKASRDTQIQTLCERSFDLLPESSELRYIRGNAGFAGFAQSSVDRGKIGRFSDLMRRISGERWNEWGSEQVTSNLLIANTDGSLPLPFPKYLSFWAHPDVPYESSAFIHFIGPHRYDQGFYRKSAQKVIAALSRAEKH